MVFSIFKYGFDVIFGFVFIIIMQFGFAAVAYESVGIFGALGMIFGPWFILWIGIRWDKRHDKYVAERKD